ncbi:hypothetical protein TSOC_010359 [Tetrabaena socialis]|uniref:FHA domain-containing protein n=1 Tax=Tetrabaena socialis TaxID=47790 RepID=A0A2J7ZTH5_9CHLO|nr:hypothetical protein TSOC_010359 [Tetrabaena socialis]|eukprot:PNH03573.1 hypothetical protein TSOC_010359 [Tetrabaena socialis]
MVWAVRVENPAAPAAGRFLLTPLGADVTVGRPPTKTDAKPDIVVPDKSVSKIHAVLRVEPGGEGGASTLVITGGAEQDKTSRKRRAEEMFNSTAAGGKKPPRGAKRA